LVIFKDDGTFQEHGILGKGSDPLFFRPGLAIVSEGTVRLTGGIPQGFTPQGVHPRCDRLGIRGMIFKINKVVGNLVFRQPGEGFFASTAIRDSVNR
jgi:hypothetical protein